MLAVAVAVWSGSGNHARAASAEVATGGCAAVTIPNGTCVDTPHGYDVYCNAGYEPNYGTGTCDTYAECAAVTVNTCAPGLPGTVYAVVCDPGFAYGNGGCVDVDECAALTVAHGTCTNTLGSYTIACDPGYELNAAGSACVDVDECLTVTVTNGTCVNTEGSYSTICRAGFIPAGPNTCADIDECLTLTIPNGTCFNTLGSWAIVCNPGFTPVSHTACVDIDECLTVTVTNGTCINTPGSYTAMCDPGFTPLANKTCVRAITLTVPGTVDVDATTPAGAAVQYSVTATSSLGLTTQVVCSPPSGSTFAAGTTTVSCTATDTAGHSAGASFTVTVKGLTAQFEETITAAAVGGNSFTSQLSSAQSTLAAGNTRGGCGSLQGFANHTRAQSGKQLSVGVADQLIADAARLSAVAGC